MFFKNKPKIFCISFQRTGTTSVGLFFKKQGFSVANWDVSAENQWTKHWFEGNFEFIFNSKAFKEMEVFEDAPWWCLDFYKVLYHRFPSAKFILFTRDGDKWYDSMVSHSSGKTLGNTYVHSYLYRREHEYFENYKSIKYDVHETDSLLYLNEAHRNHYKIIYENRNREVIQFFNRNDNKRLIHLELEDTEKWQKLGAYFDIKISPEFFLHANASKK